MIPEEYEKVFRLELTNEKVVIQKPIDILKRGKILKKGYRYIVFSTILFSTMEVALKIFSAQFNPIQMNFLRFMIGSMILLPLARKGIRDRNVSLEKKDYLFFALTGFICIVVSMVLYQMAIEFAPASTIAVLFSCNSVFVVLFAHFLLGEKIYRHTVITILLSMAGILAIISPFDFSNRFTGIVLTMLSAITFAFYIVVGSSRSKKYGGLAFTCFSFVFGSIQMLILILLTNIAPIAEFIIRSGFNTFAYVPVISGIDLHSIVSLIYVGVFVTGLGYAFYFMAMEATSAATASLVFFIKPVLAPIFALLILREPIVFSKTIGILLIVVGSLVTILKKN